MAGKERKVRNIEDETFRYTLLFLFARFFFRKYYKRINVFGLENIPYDYPVIFAPNHQNAVMDPLAVLFTAKIHPVFLARADVFKGKRLINFLTLCKILPVYRQRDGVENLGKNDEIFDATIRILKKNMSVCLMAEGNHGNKNSLRPLVKGMFRIALNAQNEIGDSHKPVMIVPVGLYYEHYIKFNKKLYVNYCKPISVKDYIELFKEKPAFALNKLKSDLAEAMSDSMIDVKDLENYENIYFLSYEYSKSLYQKDLGVKKERQRFVNMQKTIQSVDKAENDGLIFLPQLFYFLDKYRDLLKQMNLRDWIIAKKKVNIFEILWGIIILLIGLPFFIYGYLINLIPYKASSLITKKVKDLQFYSSINYLLSMIVLPIYYIILSVLAGLVFKSLLVSLVFFIVSPITGFIAINYVKFFKKFRAKTKALWLKITKNRSFLELNSLRSKIMIITDEIYIKS